MLGKSIGRYHILEQLGEGGMATVYKAFDTRLERDVAVKVIHPVRKHSMKFLNRFEREAKALAQLSHPNIVKVLDYGEYEELPYIVMEYIPGGTLKKKLGRPMPWDKAARLLAPIARALDYAHQRNIIHRDVKPSNILITESGEPTLSDFGIAKMIELEETIDLTGTGVGVGTTEYMAPEQGMGEGIDHRADIYSLGIVFYELITGQKPYRADTPMGIVIKHINNPLPRPKKIVSNIPKSVEGVLFKALEKKPNNRFQSMGSFGDVLDKIGQGQVKEPRLLKSILAISGLLIFTGIMYFILAYIGVIPAIPGILTQRPEKEEPVSQTSTLIATMIPGPTETATPTIEPAPDAYLSPQVAFVSKRDGNQEIYLMDLDGRNQRNITNSQAEDFDPSWSPDGSQIAFISDRDGDVEIFLMNNDGSNPRNITNSSSSDINPSWSPDGKQIAFSSDRGGQYDIYVMNADGSNVQQVSTNGSREFSWSPDGKKIAYTSWVSKQLYLVNSDGSGQIKISDNIAGVNKPEWSQDGNYLAFASLHESQMHGSIYTINVSGEDLQPLSTSLYGVKFLWSPKPLFIALGSTSPERGIFIIGIEDNSTNQIYNEALTSLIAWLPDDYGICFIKNQDIYTVDLGGTSVINLTNSAGYDGDPDWWWPDDAIIESANTKSALFDSIFGVWSGTVENGDVQIDVSLSIPASCHMGDTCGMLDVLSFDCQDELIFDSLQDDTIIFIRQGGCMPGAELLLKPLSDGTVSYISRGGDIPGMDHGRIYPTGEIIFEEDFDDGVAQFFAHYDLSGRSVWNIVEDEEDANNMVYEADNSSGTDYPGFTFGSSLWSDYAVEYRVKFPEINKDIQVLLNFRRSSPSSSYTQALFAFWDEVIIASEPWSRISTRDQTFENDRWYHIRVEAVGSQIRVYIDGRLTTNITNTDFQMGKVALNVSPSTHALFDDIRVISLEE